MPSRLVAGAPGWVALVLHLLDFGERHLISGPVAPAARDCPAVVCAAATACPALNQSTIEKAVERAAAAARDSQAQQGHAAKPGSWASAVALGSAAATAASGCVQVLLARRQRRRQSKAEVSSEPSDSDGEVAEIAAARKGARAVQ